MNTPIDIVIATTNSGKIKEIHSILNNQKNLKFNIKNLTDYNISEPDEPFDTCLDNAIHKAKYYAGQTLLPTLSEDAGLYVAALDGFPGVRTKDFVIESRGIVQAINNLENLLVNANDLQAYFTCAAVLYNPVTEKFISYEGSTPGVLRFPAKGTAGFGFDPVFIPNGYSQTLAELGAEVKNSISHRAIAIRGLATKIADIL